MDLITRDDLKTLLAEHPSPCLSLFMSTHRGGAEADRIRWRTHLAEAEQRLDKAGWRTAEIQELLAPGRRLLEDIEFWKNQSDGLAAFLAPQFLRLFRLPLAFTDGVEVANAFSIIPLLPLLSGNGRFFVLALSQNAVRLLQGTRDGISAVDLKGVPRNLAEALLTHDRDEPLTFHTRPTSGGGWGAIFAGHGIGIDDAKDDLLLYFQRIDRGLHPLLSEEKVPLVLAAVDYLLPIYRQANSYSYLLEQGVEGNPDRLSNKELHDRAWTIVEPQFQEDQRRALARYHQAAGTGRATSDVKQIIPAAYRGELETAFIALDKHLWGTLDPGTNDVSLHEQPEPGDEDMLNFTAIHTLRHGSMAYALRAEELPAGEYLAAICHLPLAKHAKRR